MSAKTFANEDRSGSPPLSTIGHSTRSAEAFIDILRANRIETLVDVRRFPGSRRYPQFNREALAGVLEDAGIRYVHLVDLGGRRTPKAESKNTAWRNAAFRGYADYMEELAFQRAIEELRSLAAASRTVIMCAEALWWSCHRALIADYLKATGTEVLHIADEKKSEPHPFTRAASVKDGVLSYAPVR